MSVTLQQAQTLLDLRRYEDAAQAARAVIAIEPENAEAFRILADAMDELDQGHEALSAAREAVRLEPQSYQGLTLLANIYRRFGDQENALAAASAAVATAPHAWSTHYTLAHVKLSPPHPSPRSALADIQEALRLSPHNAQIHNLHGMCLVDLKQRKQARAAYQEALRLEPTDALALNNLAALDLNSGRLTRGTKTLTAALAQAPQEQLLQENLETVLVKHMAILLLLQIVIGCIEAVVLLQGGPWAARAALGVLTLGYVIWAIRRARAVMPRGTPDVLRGLWRRKTRRERFGIAGWSLFLVATLILSFAPTGFATPIAQVLLAIVLRAAPLTAIILFVGWIQNRR